MESILGEIKEESKPRLLLHACCAPCSSYCLEYLREAFALTVFFYNPNLTEQEEYRRRVEEEKRLIALMNGQEGSSQIEILEGRYEPERFLEAAKGLETCKEGGERCVRCFALRLGETAADGVGVLVAPDPGFARHRHVAVEVLRAQGKHVPRGRRAHRETAKRAVPARGTQRLVRRVSSCVRRVAGLDRCDQRVDLGCREEAIECVVVLVIVGRERPIRIVGREHHQRRCGLAGGLQLVDDRRDAIGEASRVTPPAMRQVEDVRGIVWGVGRGNVHVRLLRVCRSLVALLVGDRVDRAVQRLGCVHEGGDGLG